MSHLINLADLPVFHKESLNINLNAQDSAQLVESINNPPKATEGLVRAIKRADVVLREEK